MINRPQKDQEANFGHFLVKYCSLCEQDHISALNEQLHQNELLAGYLAVCPDMGKRFFVAADEVEEGKG